jgi:inhibitor of cysteine peptidase
MKLLWGYMLLMVSLISCANNNQSLNVSIKKPGFVVSLPANPTTGYQWSIVEFDKNLLTLSASHFETNKTDRIGAGGDMIFTFLLLPNKNYPKHTEIKFKYARSWEQNTGMTKSVTVNFVSQ